jgi:phosphatidylglycerophosphate synthase
MTRKILVDEEFRRRALKPRDAWWAVLVVDHLALPVLAVLVRLPWVTPMRLTMVGAAFGVAAIACFGTGHLFLGAILFELRFFADCLDGKLARFQGLTSPRGAFLDLTMDVVLISGAMASLGWHLSRSPGQMSIELAAGCTFGCLVLFWLILYDLDHPAVNSAHPAPGESALARWRRHHRLVRLPGTIEVETGLLFLAPLIGNAWLLTASFVAAGAYYCVASVHLFVKLLRRTSPPAAPRQDDPQSTQLAS